MVIRCMVYKILAEFYSTRKVSSGLELQVEDCISRGFLGGLIRLTVIVVTRSYSHGCLDAANPETTAAAQSQKLENQNKRDQWCSASLKLEIMEYPQRDNGSPYCKHGDIAFLSLFSSNSRRHSRKKWSLHRLACILSLPVLPSSTLACWLVLYMARAGLSPSVAVLHAKYNWIDLQWHGQRYALIIS